MATRGVEMTIQFVVWDTANNAGKTGDLMNFTLRWVKDGAASAPTNSASEIDATNIPGLYKLTITATEADCNIGTLGGKSSTSDVSIIPVTIQFERLPDAVPGAAGGVFIAGTNAATTANITGNVTGNLSGSVGSVTGNVTGSVGSLAAQAKADVNAEVVDALAMDTYAEPSSVPAATSSLKDKLGWLFMLGRNKRTQTATNELVRNDNDSATVGASVKSDSAGTFTRGEYS
jgi:hypothetical protein